MDGEGTPSQATAAGGAGAVDSSPTSRARTTAATASAVAAGTASQAPTGYVAVDPGAVRASDADRHALVDLLSKATGEGRITLEEFADAAAAAYATVTRGELDALYRNLGLAEPLPLPPAAPNGAPLAPPPPSMVGAPAGAPTGATTTTTRTVRESGSSVVAILSGTQRRGRWKVPPSTTAFAFMGGVTLDLRDAVIESDVVEINAWALMGGVTIKVPEGIPVEISGCVIMGGRTCRIADRPVLPGAPTIRVRAGGMWGGVNVISRPSRRSRSADGTGGDDTRGSDPAPAGASADSPAAAAIASARTITTDAMARANSVVDDALDRAESASARSARTSDRSQARARRNRHDRGLDRDRSRDRSRPAEREQPTPRTSGDLLTIVCTDIVGSTRHAVAVGDQRWHAVITSHNAMVRDLLARFGGTEVKTSGDGFLITFTSARAALQFSMELQDAAAAERDAMPEVPIELRIGVHAGEVERDGTDVIGRNVTVACRLCDAAAPGEVLASSVVADLADSASDLAFGPTREHALAGIDRPLVARPAVRA